MLIKCE